MYCLYQAVFTRKYCSLQLLSFISIMFGKRNREHLSNMQNLVYNFVLFSFINQKRFVSKAMFFSHKVRLRCNLKVTGFRRSTISTSKKFLRRKRISVHCRDETLLKVHIIKDSQVSESIPYPLMMMLMVEHGIQWCLNS